MKCQGSESQTEFEFFQSLVQGPEVEVCCGPMTEIGFTDYSFICLEAALAAATRSISYLDNFDQRVLDSDLSSVSMCAKHWLIHAAGILSISRNYKNIDWTRLALSIPSVVCQTNAWDEKEILNYFNTVIR